MSVKVIEQTSVLESEYASKSLLEYMKSKIIYFPAFLTLFTTFFGIISYLMPYLSLNNPIFFFVNNAFGIVYVSTFPIYFALIVKSLLFLVLQKNEVEKRKQLNDLRLFSALLIMQILFLIAIFVILIPICGVLWCGTKGDNP